MIRPPVDARLDCRVFEPSTRPGHHGEATPRMTESAKATLAFVSLGCPKNLVDSERMLGKLTQAGYAIPGMRGKHVTKPLEMVRDEARELAADGVRELIVVGQDTTYYGLDLYGRVRLAELLRELDGVEGLEWVRLLYAYPAHFSDE